MKLYFAGMWSGKQRQKRMLVSFLELRNKQFEIDSSHDVFLDSGAYSAFTRGIKIDVSEYARFLHLFGKRFSIYANLDVIGNPKMSARNLAMLEADGLTPLPVFHYGTGFDVLKTLVEKYSYIAIGGLVPIAKNKPLIHAHLRRCFAIARHVKIHGFGINSKSILESFPFYSVDATTWLVGDRFGNICDQKSMSQRITKTTMLQKGNLAEIIAIMNGRATEVNISRFLSLEKYITELWKKRGIIFGEDHR